MDSRAYNLLVLCTGNSARSILAESIVNKLGGGRVRGFSDNAAGEVCPVWPGHPVTGHWGIPDPAAVEGSKATRMAAFRRPFEALKALIEAFLALPLATLDKASLKARMQAIGEMGAEVRVP